MLGEAQTNITVKSCKSSLNSYLCILIKFKNGTSFVRFCVWLKITIDQLDTAKPTVPVCLDLLFLVAGLLGKPNSSVSPIEDNKQRLQERSPPKCGICSGKQLADTDITSTVDTSISQIGCRNC